MSVSAGVAALLQGERAMVNGEWRKGARDGEDAPCLGGVEVVKVWVAFLPAFCKEPRLLI